MSEERDLVEPEKRKHNQEEEGRDNRDPQPEAAPESGEIESFAVPGSLSDNQSEAAPAGEEESKALRTLPETLQHSINEALHPVLSRLDALDGQVSALRQIVEQVAQQQGFFPPQLRQFSQKIDDAASSISDARIRDLLHSLLLLHDLLDQMMQPGTPGHEQNNHQRNYEVLLRQVLQTLQLNGIEPISTERGFDATIHRGVKVVPTDNPAEEGRIVQVFRKGFRSQRMILRYAEVAVMRYEGPASVSAEESTPPAINY
jgi:molecular chaperone GrpE